MTPSPTPDQKLERRLRQLAHKGTPLREMARIFEAEGHPTPRGGAAWHHHMVARLLVRWGLELQEPEVAEVRLELPRQIARWLDSRGGPAWLRRAILKAHAEEAEELRLPSPRPTRPQAGPRPSPTEAFRDQVTRARRYSGAVDGVQVRLRMRIQDEDAEHFAVAELRQLERENSKLLLILHELERELGEK